MECTYETNDNYNKTIDTEFSEDFYIATNDLSLGSNLKFNQGRYNLKTFSEFELGKQGFINHSFQLNHFSTIQKQV